MLRREASRRGGPNLKACGSPPREGGGCSLSWRMSKLWDKGRWEGHSRQRDKREQRHSCRWFVFLGHKNTRWWGGRKVAGRGRALLRGVSGPPGGELQLLLACYFWRGRDRLEDGCGGCTPWPAGQRQGLPQEWQWQGHRGTERLSRPPGPPSGLYLSTSRSGHQDSALFRPEPHTGIIQGQHTVLTHGAHTRRSHT